MTLLLLAEKLNQRDDHTGIEEAAHVVLAAYFRDWCDEQKADLYALLAEKVTADMPLAHMERIVSDCLWDNLNEWAKRHG